MWRADASDPPTYEAGDWGSPEAEALIEKDGRRWRTL
jgi:glucose-6-phosphate 1-dehydrogenase